jgi:DtxR family Mn-dependent transcriptional regulator
LDIFLGFPERDPHGDPIPDKEGNINFIEKILLATLQKNEKGICIGVKNTSPSFLKFLDKRGIILGEEITFLEKEEFDDSLLIKINQKEISISNKIANNIYIQKI